MFVRNGIKLTGTTIINGTPYEISWFLGASPTQLANLGVKYVPEPIYPDPEIYTYINNPDGTINITERTPEDLAARFVAKQEAKWEEIRTERERITWNGVWIPSVSKWIHTDTFSRTQWMAMVMMGANLPAINWKTMDGTFVTTTPALAGAVFQAVATADTTIFGIAEYHRQQMLASATPSTYDFSGLWPQTFGG